MPLWRVRVAIGGSPEAAYRSAVPDFQHELDDRSYLVSPSVVWDEESGRLIVTAGYEAGSAGEAVDALNDELSDCVSAYLETWEDDFRDEVLSVEPY